MCPAQFLPAQGVKMDENITLNAIYSEIKKLNRKMDALENLIIPQEKASGEELEELDALLADAKCGNTTPFSKLKK